MIVHFTSSAFKEYKKLPSQYKNLFDNILSKYKRGELIDLKPIQGEKNKFRIRFGKYRALFIKISPDILIVEIGSRGDIYK